MNDKKSVLQISIIKTDAGKCFVSDCMSGDGYNYEYHKTALDKLLFNGEKATPCYAKNWYEISSYPQKIERIVTDEYTNQRYELNDASIESERYPRVIKAGAIDTIDDDIKYALYTYKSDRVPEYTVEIEFELIPLCEIDNFKDSPKFDYPAISTGGFNDHLYTITNHNIKHSLIDCIILPPPVRGNSPCKISSKKMYDIVRKHIKDNIDNKIAKITSDYDFCFEVKKIIPLIKPKTYSYQDIFARTKKQRAKIHYKTDTHKEVSVYEMTHEKENYRNYTPIKSFQANNEWELKEMIDNFLSEVIYIINLPLEQCSHCNGTGYKQD